MLAHNLIRRDINVIDLHLNKTFDSIYIKNLSNIIKHKIYNKLEGQTVGSIIYIGTNDFHFVVPALIAIWELGASVFLNDANPVVQKLPYFQKFFDVVDLALGCGIATFDNNDRSAMWGDTNKILIVNPDLNYSTTPEFNKPLNNSITEDSIAYYTTSSGTTSDPKLLSFTHKQTVMMSDYIKQSITTNDLNIRPYHFKTLHHGSLFNSFALPLLNSCQTHYSGQFPGGDANKFLTTVSKLFVEHNITHFLVPYNWIREFYNIENCDLSQLTLCTIQGNTNQEMQDLLDRFSVKQVINYFGCSEVGTVFIGITTKDNVKSYNPNRFTHPLPYLDINLHQSTVDLKWKHKEEWFTIADKIVYTEGAYWFYGRDLTFNVGEKQIDLGNFINFVKQHIETDQLTLVPDYTNQLLYLATYHDKLSHDQIELLNNSITQTFGKEFIISKTHWFDPVELMFGMKISGPLLLYLFQEKKEIYELY